MWVIRGIEGICGLTDLFTAVMQCFWNYMNEITCGTLPVLFITDTTICALQSLLSSVKFSSSLPLCSTLHSFSIPTYMDRLLNRPIKRQKWPRRNPKRPLRDAKWLQSDIKWQQRDQRRLQRCKTLQRDAKQMAINSCKRTAKIPKMTTKYAKWPQKQLQS